MAAALLLPLSAAAHIASDGFLRLTVEGSRISGTWDVALLDLHQQVPLDLDGDEEIRWGELKQRRPDIEALGRAGLALRADGEDCPLGFGGMAVAQRGDRNYLSMQLSAECPAPVLGLRVGYRLMFERDPEHRGLLKLSFNGEHSAIFSPDHPVQDFGIDQPPTPVLRYAAEGLQHVWMGLDHVLFLITLALPAAVRRVRGGWQVCRSASAALLGSAGVLTAFTVAHAATLTLVLLGVFTLPSRWVESAVALTVMLAALNNLYPVVQRGLWLLGFGFGLIHGAAIASALSALELGSGSMARMLLGFNLGVEAGQLAVFAAVFPLVYFLRDSVAYRRLGVVGGSLAVFVIGTAWLIERALGVSLPV